MAAQHLQAFDIVRNNIQMFGVRQTVKDLLVRLLVASSDDFDRRHGVSTAGRISSAESGIRDLSVLDGAFDYEPTRVEVMRHILAHAASQLDPRDFTFVDLGCGKGRAVLMASELPFRAVVGVEASARYCAEAELNLDSFFACRGTRARGVPRAQVRITCADAADFEFPGSHLLIYMYNPFRASVLQRVLERLARLQAQQGCRVYVSSSCPVHSQLFRAHPAFRHQRTFRVLSRNSCWDFWECRAPEG